MSATAMGGPTRPVRWRPGRSCRFTRQALRSWTQQFITTGGRYVSRSTRPIYLTASTLPDATARPGARMAIGATSSGVFVTVGERAPARDGALFSANTPFDQAAAD